MEDKDKVKRAIDLLASIGNSGESSNGEERGQNSDAQ